MQFCGGGGLSRPCPNVSGGTMRNGSVEATSPTSGKSPWCRLLPCLLRSPRSAPSPRTTLLHEPSAAVLGSRGSGGCDLYQKIITFIAVQRDRLNAAFGAYIRRAPAVNTLRNLFLALGRDDLEAAFRRHARELNGT